MNLQKSFNYKYFIQNIKKSRGLLAFIFGIVPLLNIIMLIIFISEKESFITFNTLSVVTLIGSYFIPIVFALSLFGFVFKRKSVDFVMSKPLSRKTIYVTNFFGGLGVLVLFMLLNTTIFGIFSLCFKSVVLPFALLIDYFVLWLISYIFMFVVAVLAITLSGNVMGSIVIILIVSFLYPFFAISNHVLDDSHFNYGYIKCTTDTCAPANYNCYNDAECKSKVL
ncbi:MAG: hypothetical protein K2J20_00985, partial [Bacilli bacterium]|nr:hypothetical protein [Bacilli bacterium]